MRSSKLRELGTSSKGAENRFPRLAIRTGPNESIASIVEAGKRHGKFLGRPAITPEAARRYMEQGFLLFQAPTELGFMAAGARRYLEPFDKVPLDKSSDKLPSRGLY